MDYKTNQVKLKVPVDHESEGKEQILIILLEFYWLKCSAMAIPEKVNGELVVAIVGTRSAGVVIMEGRFKRLELLKDVDVGICHHVGH